MLAEGSHKRRNTHPLFTASLRNIIARASTRPPHEPTVFYLRTSANMRRIARVSTVRLARHGVGQQGVRHQPQIVAVRIRGIRHAAVDVCTVRSFTHSLQRVAVGGDGAYSGDVGVVRDKFRRASHASTSECGVGLVKRTHAGQQDTCAGSHTSERVVPTTRTSTSTSTHRQH